MQQRIVACVFAVVVIVLLAAPTYALPDGGGHVLGYIICDVNGNGYDDEDTPIGGVKVIVELADSGSGGPWIGYTDATGRYSIDLGYPYTSYSISLDETTLPPNSTVTPGLPFVFSLDGGKRHFLVTSPNCGGESGACWLTGGGVKFSSLTGTRLAEHGPTHSFGGNVFPSCSSEPGDGGQWNHISHKGNAWHFQGWTIDTVRCGNVPGIEPGSESPMTPFNYIEFEGIGTLKGIKGNKESYDAVHFFARAEDRNEPGSRGAKDGIDIDRYFLHVWDPDSLTTLLLVDMDGDPVTMDPITITGGNLQLHISSCDNPPLN